MILDGITSILFLLVAGAIMFGIIYSVSQNTHRITKEVLESLSDSFEIVEKIKVEGDGNQSYIIDYAVINKKGVYLLKIVDREGIITGDELQPKWKEKLRNGVEEFNNPIVNIVEVIRGLRNDLDDIATDIPIYPIVVFPNKANLDNLYSDALVISANELQKHIKDDEKTITNKQFDNILERLALRSQRRTREI